MPKKIFFVSFYDREGDTWGQYVRAASHEDAFMQAYEALSDDDELISMIDLPAKFYVDEIEPEN